MEHFRLPKSILKHEIMSGEKQMELRLFLYIIGNACYKDGVQVGKTNITLVKGQWLRSQRKLCEDLGAGPNKINNAISWLIEKKLISVKHTRLGSIFSVHNFNIYQGFERYPDDNAELLPLLDEEHQKSLRYPADNGERYPESNNTNKVLTNKPNIVNKIYNLNSVNNIRSQKHNERDPANIEWEKYNFRF